MSASTSSTMPSSILPYPLPSSSNNNRQPQFLHFILVVFATINWFMISCCCSASIVIPIQPDNIFTLGQQQQQQPLLLSFRSLLLNPKLSSLYAGGRGHLFRLWLYNINDTSSPTLYSHREFTVRPEEREECLRMGNTERECAFWVRQIFQRGDGSLLLCSSQAMKPQLGSVDGQSLSEVLEARTQIGICSQHDGLNTTAVYTEHGNPNGLAALYSGIRTGLSLENHLIYRPPLMSPEADGGGGREVHPALRTSIYDSNWLNEPQFVGSYSAGPHVLFFFRELLAADCFNCPAGVGKGAWVSRVARICKSDLGGRQVLRQVWTSFVKARLNCSLTGFSFDQIQSVTRLDWPPAAAAEEFGGGAAAESMNSGTSTTTTTFYATFNRGEKTPFQASAICAFTLGQINQLFDTGAFLEQSMTSGNSGSAWWNPTPADQVPQNRPGSCQPDSRQLSDEQLHFAKSHLLMAESVPPLGGRPLLHRRGQLLGRLVVDPLQFLAKGSAAPGNSDDDDDDDRQQPGRVLLLVHSPSHNSLLKVLHLPGASSNDGAARAHLLAIYRLPSPAASTATTSAAADGGGGAVQVHAMAILPGEYLYLATDSMVAQYRLGQCAAYGDRCAQCAADPFCSWSIARRECFPREPAHASAVGWLSGGEPSEAPQRCAKWSRPRQVRLFPGDAVHLECPGADQQDQQMEDNVRWTFDGEMVPQENSANRVFTLDGGLVLLNVTQQAGMAGTWACTTSTTVPNGIRLTLAEYALSIDGEDCAKPKSVEQFHAVQREWCRRMDAYRSNLSKWQSLYDDGQEKQQLQANCPTNAQVGEQSGTAADTF